MKNILKIISISKPLHGLTALIGALIVGGALLDLVSPIISKFIVDQIVLQVKNKNGDFHVLTFLILLTLAVNLLSLILSTASGRLGDHLAGKLYKFLTEKFYDKVLTLPSSYFDTEVSGKILNQLARGIFSIQNFINSATNFILPTFLQAIFTIVVLAYYNRPIAFFTFLLFPIYFVITYYSTKKWGQYQIEKNKIEDIYRGRIQEVIANINLVKSFINEKNEYEKASKSLEESNRIYAKQSNFFYIFDFLSGLSLNVILFAINIVVFYNTFRGSLTIGEMVLIIQLVAQARRPLFAMSFILSNTQNAEAGSKEYFGIMSLKSAENYKTEEELIKLKNPKIEFKNVGFNYEKSGTTLDNVSFKIADKETVALVGPSGAGKTTIVNLILKFYKPSRGKILLNGKDYKSLSHKFVRDNIALVFQESELFSTTVRDNVRYAKEDATDGQIWQALKLANAEKFVKELPKGLNNEIGERGVRLSGGQKQRIQIARAILKNSPILILDEATSSLDAKSEKEVHKALEHLMKDKLVIVIAHRFSTIQNVDKVIVIDNAKIVDQGSPLALSKRKGIYKDLLTYQIEGNKKLLENFEIY